MTKYWTLAAMLVGFGCGDKSGDSADTSVDADTDTDTDADTDADFTVDYSWNSDGLTVTIENGLSSSYDFGMAETAAGGDGWYGEDCFDGTAGYQICHTANQNGLNLSTVASPDEVEASSTTLFSDATAFDTDGADRLSYYLSDGTDCWTWGHDLTYYSGCQ